MMMMCMLYVDQELRQSFVDMGYMRGVLAVSEGAQATINAATLSPTSAGVDSSKPSLPVDPLQASSSPSSIEFRNVTFHYRPRTYHNCGKMDAEASQGINGEGDSEETSNSTSTISLLKNVSFSIQPGQNVAIVGPSGSGECYLCHIYPDDCYSHGIHRLLSGKSTILKLITRMLYPESGDILLDRTSIVELGVEEVRRCLRTRPCSMRPCSTISAMAISSPPQRKCKLSSSKAICRLPLTSCHRGCIHWWVSAGPGCRAGSDRRSLSRGESDRCSRFMLTPYLIRDVVSLRCSYALRYDVMIERS